METAPSSNNLVGNKVVESSSIFLGGASAGLGNVRAVGMKENLKVFDFDDEDMSDVSISAQSKPAAVVSDNPSCKASPNRRYTSGRDVSRRGGGLATRVGRGVVKRTSRVKDVRDGGDGGRKENEECSASDPLRRNMDATQDEKGIALSSKLPASLGVKLKQDKRHPKACATSGSNIRHGPSKDANAVTPSASRDVTPPPIEVGVSDDKPSGVLLVCGLDRGAGNRKRKREMTDLEKTKDVKAFHSVDPYAFDELEGAKSSSDDSNSKLGAKLGSTSKTLGSGSTKLSVLDSGSISAISDSNAHEKVKPGSIQRKQLLESESKSTSKTRNMDSDSGSKLSTASGSTKLSVLHSESGSSISDSSAHEKMKGSYSQGERLLECEPKPELASEKGNVDSDSDMLRQIDSMLEEHGDTKDRSVPTREVQALPTCSSYFVKSKIGRLKKSSSDASKCKPRNYTYTTRPSSSPALVAGVVVPRMTKKSFSWSCGRKRERERSVAQSPKKAKKVMFLSGSLLFVPNLITLRRRCSCTH